ncbi:MAG: hypothetical protein ACNA8N_13220 [Trueperaceae bacterium]
MPRLVTVGIVLILLGTAGFVVPRIDCTTEETVIDAGPIEVEVEQRRTVTIPDVAAGAVVTAGVVLTIVGASRRA